MSGTSFEGALKATGLQVGGNLSWRIHGQDKTSFQERSSVWREGRATCLLIGASFDGALIAGLLQVGGNLFMNSASLKLV